MADSTAAHPDTSATPNGCGVCGHPRYAHHQFPTPGGGLHTYRLPTDAQRLQRMRARRATRTSITEGPAPA
jgi:hypothetical protein